MACVQCPYTSSYQLLWRDVDEPALIAVMLRCCAGPELQIRRGPTVLLSEIFKAPSAVVSRADELRGTFVLEHTSDEPDGARWSPSSCKTSYVV